MMKHTVSTGGIVTKTEAGQVELVQTTSLL